MKKNFLVWIVLSLFAPAIGNATEVNYADIVEKVMPSVVSVSAVQKNQQPIILEMPQFPSGSPFEQFFKDFIPKSQGQFSNKSTSIGSGFIVDKTGIIMTNAHVIEGAQDLNVIFHDNSKLKAKILSYDKKSDIALLQVETNKSLTPVIFGNSDKARVGDRILAIGNPFGLGSTVTSGIISARARDIQAGPYDDFIQTDASINRGNSGGPMFNMQGEVIGINTAIFSPSGGSVGIGFAIPSNMAEIIFENLLKYGKIKRGQIGIRIQSVTEEIAQSLGMDKPVGAMVASVEKNGPADKAGLKAGDVILYLNEDEIMSMRQLPKIISQSPIDEKISAIIWRGGREIEVKIIVEEMFDNLQEITEKNINNDTDPINKENLEIKDIGITINNINDEIRQIYSLPKTTKGVVVTKVEEGSEAEAKGLVIGDIIVEVKQTPIVKTSDVLTLIKSAKNQNLKSILMLINNQNGLNFIALRLQ